MPGETIIVTGISGSGSRDFCKKYQRDGRKVRVYHVGDMTAMLAQDSQMPPIPKQNLHNIHLTILNDKIREAYKSIQSQTESNQKGYDKILVDTHAQFFWNQVFFNAGNPLRIPADLFITIIDKPSSIKERQLRNEYGRTQQHDLRDLLLWQNIEVNMTDQWARATKKPHYILSSKQNPDIIDSLLENYFLIYSSFPMTDAESKANSKIVAFKNRLRELRKLERQLMHKQFIEI
jgi:adenylate kinase